MFPFGCVAVTRRQRHPQAATSQKLVRTLKLCTCSAESAPLAEIFPQSPGGVFPAACPSRVLLDHVMSKWGVLVLVSLTEGPRRWSELRRRAQGISEKMLA